MRDRPGVVRDAVGLGWAVGLVVGLEPGLARAHDGSLVVAMMAVPAALVTAVVQAVLLTRRSWRPRWSASTIGALLVGLPPVLWLVLSTMPWPGDWLLWAATMAYGAGLSGPLSWTLARQGRPGASVANTVGCALAVPALAVFLVCAVFARSH